MSMPLSLASLTSLPPELIHAIAFSSHLSAPDVSSLAQTCTTMASILTHDPYGRALHRALLGVIPNLTSRHYTAARYAATRGWYAGDPTTLWKRVADVAVDVNIMGDDLPAWEKVMMTALSLLPVSHTPTLVETWESEHRSGDTTSLLHVAASVGSETLATWVLERGGEDVLEMKTSTGATPLLLACAAGHLGVATMLVERGADTTVRDDDERNILIAASGGGDPHVVAYVLGLGGLDVDEEDDLGHCPLSLACHEGDLDVVRVLVEQGGVDVDLAGRNPMGPLRWAVVGGNGDVVQALVDAGSGSGESKEEGVWMGALMVAALRGHPDAIRVLLDAGVEPNLTDWEGNTALIGAVREGHVDVVKELLGQGGADVNQAGCKGLTPLHWACLVRSEDMVKLLLAMGAHVEAVNDWGETVADIARKGGYDNILALL